MTPRDTWNVGCAHGQWGEDVATEFLRRGGYVILDRNSHPVEKDARLELDIVTWERRTDTLVFVEVKQHATMSRYARRLQSVNRKKKANLRRACNAWLRRNSWPGAFRFDVLEIYGTPLGGAPVIDHIKGVGLFPHPNRFVKWN